MKKKAKKKLRSRKGVLSSKKSKKKGKKKKHTARTYHATTKTSAGKKRKSKSKYKYQRGDLGRAIYKLFDKVGIDKVTFTQAEKVALKAKPDTTYGKAYFSWHKNAYRNDKDL